MTIKGLSIRVRENIAIISIGIFVTGIYLITSCPTVRYWDSGELSAAAYTLGIAHAPGFPLYVICGRTGMIFSLFGAAYTMSLLSALWGGLAVGFFILMLRDWVKRLSWGIVIAGLALAWSGGLWSQANRAEVYALSLLLTAVSFYLAVKYVNSGSMRYLILAGYIWGLAGANHTSSAAAALPALIALVLQNRSMRDFKLSHSFCFLTGAIIGWSIYLLIPIRSALCPEINWGRGDNWQSFIHLITVKDFAFSLKFKGWLDFAQRLYIHWKLLYENIPLPLMIFTIIGFWRLRYQWWILLLFLCGSGVTLMREALPQADHLGYLLPVIIALYIWTGEGFDYVGDKLHTIKFLSGKKIKHVILSLAIVLIMTPIFIKQYEKNNLRGNYSGENFGRAIIGSLDEDSIVLFNDISSYFICRYLQTVEHFRRDCDLILPGMLIEGGASRNWYYQEIIERTKISGLNPLPFSALQVIARIVERNHNARPIYCEYGEHYRPFYKYLKPEGWLFRYDLENKLNSADNYILPNKDIIGEDQETREFYGSRLYALGLYYQDRGELRQAEQYIQAAEELVKRRH